LRAGLGEALSFMVKDRPLFENMVLNAAVCIMVGTINALLVVFAHNLSPWLIGYPGNYSTLQTAIGVGALAGSVLTGALARAGGLRILGGIAGFGAAGVALALAPNILLATGAIAALGLFNLIWFVPTQTLILLRTPRELAGRVIAVRRTITLGVTTLAMFVAGYIAQMTPAATVIGAAGLLTILVAGLGLLRPALRAPEMIDVRTGRISAE